jgi:hypothetical protein
MATETSVRIAYVWAKIGNGNVPNIGLNCYGLGKFAVKLRGSIHIKKVKNRAKFVENSAVTYGKKLAKV